MKRYSISLSAAALLACLAFSQCRKDDDGPSETRRNLTGTWKVTAYGLDMNGNAVPDLEEMVPAPDNPAVIYTYAADGTGSMTTSYNGIPLSASSTWELSNADRSLKVVSTASLISFTQYFNIMTISATDMILSDTSNGGRSFIVSRKQ